nr:DUF2285 domain-containing protein [Mesorhizobium sp. L-8-10]
MFSKHRLRALECLNELSLGQSRKTRLTFVLRGLDGSLAGASHREVAEGLIGLRRGHADCGDPRDHLPATFAAPSLVAAPSALKVNIRPVRQPANSSELKPGHHQFARSKWHRTAW